MPKKMKFERKLARDARKDLPAQDAPPLEALQAPPPEQSADLASQGIELNRGNANQLPLSDVGHAEVEQIGEQLADKGGIDEIRTSPSVRTDETANAIAEANPGEPIPIQKDPNLESWAQGNAEGQPKQLVKDQIRALIRTDPGRKIPGQGAMSTRQGESFDDYRLRALPAVRGLMQELAQNPTKKIAVPDHSSVTKLTEAWAKNGTPDDFSVRPEVLDGEPAPPGSVRRFYPNGKGEWELSDVSLADKSPLQPGIYFIRHGSTPWAQESYDKSNAGQQAIGQMAKHIQSGDFGRARAVAKSAALKAHLSDDQISSAIDASLPSPEQAADLPTHHLLAVASAASPAVRSQYADLINQRITPEALMQLHPRDQRDISSHLQALGLQG